MYRTKRMQRVLSVAFIVDGSYVMSGSDDMNVRVWKANASEQTGVVLPGERKTLKEVVDMNADLLRDTEQGEEEEKEMVMTTATRLGTTSAAAEVGMSEHVPRGERERERHTSIANSLSMSVVVAVSAFAIVKKFWFFIDPVPVMIDEIVPRARCRTRPPGTASTSTTAQNQASEFTLHLRRLTSFLGL